VRASGQIVRGHEEAGPDPQELLRETNFDNGSSDDESVSSYSDRWVPGSGMPGSFCLVFGPLAPVVSVEGGPRAAAVFATVFPLILESSSSADFGRRSKHPAGFRMAASAYSNMWLGGSGSWLLSFPPVAGRWLCQSPASLPHIYQVEGIYQVSFPCREVFPSDTACYA
jgi:hypothetical protein